MLATRPKPVRCIRSLLASGRLRLADCARIHPSVSSLVTPNYRSLKRRAVPRRQQDARAPATGPATTRHIGRRRHYHHHQHHCRACSPRIPIRVPPAHRIRLCRCFYSSCQSAVRPSVSSAMVVWPVRY